MTLLQVYLIVTALVTFWAALQIPIDQPPWASPSRAGRVVDNIGGSFVLAIALGWLIWPFALGAAVKVRRSR